MSAADLAALAMDSDDTDEEEFEVVPNELLETTPQHRIMRSPSGKKRHRIPDHIQQQLDMKELFDHAAAALVPDEFDPTLSPRADPENIDVAVEFETMVHQAGFRIILLDLSCAANIDADARKSAAAQCRSAEDTADAISEPSASESATVDYLRFPGNVVQVIQHSFADVVVLTGIGSGAERRDVVSELVKLLGEPWQASKPDKSRRNREMGRGVAILSAFPIMDEIKVSFSSSSTGREPASGRAVRISVSPEAVKGMQCRVVGPEREILSPHAIGRRHLLWVAGIDLGDETDAVAESQMRDLKTFKAHLRGGLPTFVAATLRSSGGDRSSFYRAAVSRLKCNLIDAAHATALIRKYASHKEAERHLGKTAFTSKERLNFPARAIGTSGEFNSTEPSIRQGFIFVVPHDDLERGHRDRVVIKDVRCDILTHERLQSLHCSPLISDHLPVQLTWTIDGIKFDPLL